MYLERKTVTLNKLFQLRAFPISGKHPSIPKLLISIYVQVSMHLPLFKIWTATAMHRIFQIVRCRMAHIMVRIRIWRYVPSFGINLRRMEALINFQMCERTHINRLAYDSFRDFSKTQKPILNGSTLNHLGKHSQTWIRIRLQNRLGDARYPYLERTTIIVNVADYVHGINSKLGTVSAFYLS